MDNSFNETTETDFISKLIDDGILLSSHMVNTLIDLQSHDNNNNNNTITNDTYNTTIIYKNDRHRQPVNSTELIQYSDP